MENEFLHRHIKALQQEQTINSESHSSQSASKHSQSELAGLKSQLAEAQARLSETAAELKEAKAQATESSRVNQELNCFKMVQVGAREKANDEAQARKLQQELLSAQAELLTLKQTTGVDSEQHSIQLAAAQEKVCRIEQEHSTAMSTMVSELVSTQNDQMKKSAQATELKLQLAAAQAKVLTLTQTSDIDGEELAAAKRQVADLKHKHTATVSAAAKRNSKLSSDLSSAQLDVEMLKESISKQGADAGAKQILSQKLEAAERNLNTLEQKMSQVEVEHEKGLVVEAEFEAEGGQLPDAVADLTSKQLAALAALSPEQLATLGLPTPVATAPPAPPAQVDALPIHRLQLLSIGCSH